MSTPGELATNPTAGRPLRVCHLAKFYPPATGGIESHLRTLAQAQARLGASVRVVCVNHLDAAGRDVTWEALAATPTVVERDGDVELLRVGRRASLFRFELCPGLARLGRTLRDWGADVVHLHVPNPTMLLALLPSLRRPLVISYHSDVVKQRKLSLAMRPFETPVYRFASAVLAASPPYAEASPWLRRYLDKVRVLPYGIDLAGFTAPSPSAVAEAARLRQAHGTPLWLSVCRLVYYKGLPTALEALCGVPGKLLVIGEGPLAGPLRQQAERLGVGDRVVFRGRGSEEEVIGAYQAATAYWFPSNARSEAFGIVQLEAMASGCPVINTAIPHSGVSWVSRHEETGLTVPMNDPAALAAAANRLLLEPELRHRLGEAGQRRVLEEFDHRLMARRSIEIYRRVLS